MLENFSIIYQLMRLDKPIPYLLAFYPSVFGLLLAIETPSDLALILLFFIGSILARAAGCIVNDICDQKIDAQVTRTKDRPIASGKISNKSAIIVLFILLLCCLAILLSLSITAIIIGFITFGLMFVYPLMKRYTYFPQIFLGIVFNLGALIAYATIKNEITASAIIIYIGCCFWTIAYDTIYGFMDIKDDKKIGVKSMAIFLEHKHYKMWLGIFYTIFIICYLWANNLVYIGQFTTIGAVLSHMLLMFQIINLDIENVENCSKSFKRNNIIGAILAIAMLFEYLFIVNSIGT